MEQKCNCCDQTQTFNTQAVKRWIECGDFKCSKNRFLCCSALAILLNGTLEKKFFLWYIRNESKWMNDLKEWKNGWKCTNEWMNGKWNEWKNDGSELKNINNLLITDPKFRIQ